jgi:hypothetical protein
MEAVESFAVVSAAGCSPPPAGCSPSGCSPPSACSVVASSFLPPQEVSVAENSTPRASIIRAIDLNLFTVYIFLIVLGYVLVIKIEDLFCSLFIRSEEFHGLWHSKLDDQGGAERDQADQDDGRFGAKNIRSFP